MGKEKQKPRDLTDIEWQFYLDNSRRLGIPLQKDAIDWWMAHNSQVDPLIKKETGSDVTWGPHDRTTPVVPLIEDIIGPENDPYAQKPRFKLWPFQGSHEETDARRPTEDKALNKKRKK